MRLIDSDWLLDQLSGDDPANMEDYYYNAIKEAPTVEAELVKRGKWIKKRFGRYVCSECGLIHIPILSKPNKRCPKCEAKMDGKEKEE